MNSMFEIDHIVFTTEDGDTISVETHDKDGEHWIANVQDTPFSMIDEEVARELCRILQVARECEKASQRSINGDTE